MKFFYKYSISDRKVQEEILDKLMNLVQSDNFESLYDTKHAGNDIVVVEKDGKEIFGIEKNIGHVEIGIGDTRLTTSDHTYDDDQKIWWHGNHIDRLFAKSMDLYSEIGHILAKKRQAEEDKIKKQRQEQKNKNLQLQKQIEKQTLDFVNSQLQYVNTNIK